MKFDFLNKSGETLSGRLELPASEPRAYALFAHCFTCSKDIVAPNVIAKALTANGIAVLRFDFTGLGSSQGDFSNTNFSSNVEDIFSACEELEKRFEYPQILIGHSLGGAAVLKAAQKMPCIKAVATIGAPSSADHVGHLFSDNLEQIEKDGKAEVNLAGRTFTIKKQFIDDIKGVTILDGIKRMKKALLVMHAPLDNTVGVEHAAKIFSCAQHPKSYVSLDNADHLLMKRQDAKYAADVIGSWVTRYISPERKSEISVEGGVVLVKSRAGAKFTQDIHSKDHRLVADEPLSVKGDNLGLNPYELLLAGLGACTSMTMKMYADHKGIPLEGVEVRLKHQKIHAKDCGDCETTSGKIDKVEKEIVLIGPLTPEQRKRLHEISEKCPVNRTLQSEIKVESNLTPN